MQNVSESLGSLAMAIAASARTRNQPALSSRKPAETATSRTRRKAAPIEPDATALFKVLIGYEDFPTGQRAMKLCGSLIEKLGEEFQFRTCFWKFDLLRAPKLRAMAAQDVTEADVVLISAYAGGGLPDEVISWLAACSSKKPKVSGSLVALLDQGNVGRTKTSQTHDYLKRFARKRGFEFFSHCLGKPTEPEAGSEAVIESEEAQASVLEQILQRSRALSPEGCGS